MSALAALARTSRREVEERVLPFWLQHGIDRTSGGFFTCFDNRGRHLVSTDKYTWSQGRFLWVLGRAIRLARNGLIDIDVAACEAALSDGVRFVCDHAVMVDGSGREHCVFLTDQAGSPKEPWAGSGYAVSVFADCFVVMGLAEAARVSGDAAALEQSLCIFDTLLAQQAEGRVRTEPYPTPEGFSGWAVPMISLNAAQDLAAALESAQHARAAEVRRTARDLAAFISGRLASASLPADLSADSAADGDTLLARHRTPGHIVEAAWFVLREAGTDSGWTLPACRRIRNALELGWDTEHGGLLRYIDVDGGRPRGRSVGGRYEDLISQTWDTKLWWPHAEALYAAALAARMCLDSAIASDLDAWCRTLHDYTFATFPAEPGREWIQNRDRTGRPLDAVVALPVKDPFHIARSLLLLVELACSGRISEQATTRQPRNTSSSTSGEGRE